MDRGPFPPLPDVLARGGSRRYGAGTIDWTFKLLLDGVQDGWDLIGVARVCLVPFVGDHVVVLRLRERTSLVGGTLEPGEHWCIAATRGLMEEAGARLPPSPADRPVLHPFGVMHCHSQNAEPYLPHQPHPDHLRVTAWCEVELTGAPTMPKGGEVVEEVLTLPIEEACRLVASEDSALVRLAADLRSLGVSDATWTRDSVRLLEEHYVRASTPQGQSGKHGDAADWELSRRLVTRALDRDGTFLDLGCANGLLMESIVRWAAADGVVIDPYGLDASARLIALARSRLPHWADHLYVGDVLTWVAPRRFQFVHTMIDLVPPRRRVEWLWRVLQDLVAPGGRLIVRDYAGIGDRLRVWGLPVAGTAVQPRGARPAQEAAWMDAQGADHDLPSPR